MYMWACKGTFRDNIILNKFTVNWSKLEIELFTIFVLSCPTTVLSYYCSVLLLSCPTTVLSYYCPVSTFVLCLSEFTRLLSSLTKVSWVSVNRLSFYSHIVYLIKKYFTWNFWNSHRWARFLRISLSCTTPRVKIFAICGNVFKV